MLWTCPAPVYHLEREVIIVWEIDFAKRHANYFVLKPIIVANREFALAEIDIPPDSVDDVLNGDHSVTFSTDSTTTRHLIELVRDENRTGYRIRSKGRTAF